MIEICALASGSNGNCYYIGNKDEAVLIDAGVSRRQIIKRMKLVGLNIRKVKAVFISHEHADHIRGVRVLTDFHDITAYITKPTLYKARPDNRPSKVNIFTPGQVISVGGIKVHSFSKQHDAVDPTSFRIQIEEKSVGVFTDIGAPCANVKEQLALCDVAFLESNYDEKLLWSGPYPHYLKQRVSSDEGHLSNDQAVELVKPMVDSVLKTIFLSHISADNNRVDIALAAFNELQEYFQILPTSRFEPSQLLHLEM